MTMTEAGGHVRYGIKPPAVSVLRGKTAHVWANGARIGALHRWEIRGANGDWEGDALRYALDPAFDGSAVVIRFAMSLRESGGRGGEDEVVIEIVAEGHIASPFTADGEMHREVVKLKGTRLEVA